MPRPSRSTHHNPIARTRTSAALTAGVALLAGLALVFSARFLRQEVRVQGRLPVEMALPVHAPRNWHETGHATPRTTVYVRDDARGLAALFDRLGYTLAEVRTGDDVPRVYTTALPPDLERLPGVAERKSLFLRALLPLVLRENERLHTDRKRLLRLRAGEEAGAAPGGDDARWLAEQYAVYGLEPGDMARLVRRLDEVPASLALAQAATESAWGTSRFVQEGNALFGMWTWSPDVPGIVPQERPDDARHRVRAFATLGDSVHAYVHTLNTHWAYADFRRLRETQRKRGRGPNGLALVAGLSRYAETRADYIASLRSLMRANALTRLDRASLDTGGFVASVDAGSRLVAFQEPRAPSGR